MNPRNIILLVEDHAGDVELAVRAARKSNPCNEVVVAADGMEALDYAATALQLGLYRLIADQRDV